MRSPADRRAPPPFRSSWASPRGTALLRVALGAAVVSAVAAFGCGGASVRDACERGCACGTGCTADAESACETRASAEQSAAEQAGCAAEFDDYIGCAATSSCGSVGCDSQVTAYSQCLAASQVATTGASSETGGRSDGGAATSSGGEDAHSTGSGSGQGSGSGSHSGSGSGSGAGSGSKSPCQRAGWTHFLECLGDPPTDYWGVCTAADVCAIDKCFAGADCRLWQGTAPASELTAFDDCVKACGN